MIHKMALALCVLFALSFSPYVFAESNASKALLDRLYDVRQLTQIGVSFEEYSKQVTELALALGRFEREKEGKKYSASDLAMQSASEYYIKAKEEWAERLTVTDERLVALRTQLLQIEWEGAEIHLKKIKSTKSTKPHEQKQ